MKQFNVIYITITIYGSVLSSPLIGKAAYPHL